MAVRPALRCVARDVSEATCVTRVTPAGTRPVVVQRSRVQVVRPGKAATVVGTAVPPGDAGVAGVDGADGRLTNGEAMYTTPDERLPGGAGLHA